jgi:hypothetical protein
MRPNLDSLTEEIQQFLEAEHFIIFRSRSRVPDEARLVEWDSERHSDFRQFVDCALKLGVRLINFHAREFNAGYREDAVEQLEECELPREEKRELERRIEELGLYEGFVCAIELSFDFDGRVYVFDLETEWYEEWHEIMDEIEDAIPGEEDGPGGPYNLYSNN